MNTNELIRSIQERFRERILEIEEKVPLKVYANCKKEDMPEISSYLFNELGLRYIVGAGIDRRPATGDFAVTHFFSLDQDKIYVILSSSVDSSSLEVESITPKIPAAAWAEREYQDLLGIVPRGHPDPRRLVLADDWPEGLHPLRKDFPCDYKPEPSPVRNPKMKDPPPGATVVPIGPFFPVLEEPAYFRLFVQGEEIVGCDYRGFYNHRGIEKLGDSVLTYNQIPFVAERICGI